MPTFRKRKSYKNLNRNTNTQNQTVKVSVNLGDTKKQRRTTRRKPNTGNKPPSTTTISGGGPNPNFPNAPQVGLDPWQQNIFKFMVQARGQAFQPAQPWVNLSLEKEKSDLKMLENARVDFIKSQYDKLLMDKSEQSIKERLGYDITGLKERIEANKADLENKMYKGLTYLNGQIQKENKLIEEIEEKQTPAPPKPQPTIISEPEPQESSADDADDEDEAGPSQPPPQPPEKKKRGRKAGYKVSDEAKAKAKATRQRKKDEAQQQQAEFMSMLKEIKTPKPRRSRRIKGQEE